jgi:protein-S-isoprenylcysteine O-methyltransferase Ste14
VSTSGITARAASLLRASIGALLATALDAALIAIALGGPAALLGHARALALLAAWGLGGLLLAILRPVRTHDPVELDAESRWTLIALFVIPLSIPPLSAWAERAGWAPLPGGASLRWAGVGLSAAGLAIRIAAMRQLGSRFSPFVAVQKGHALETTGLYRWVRHPGYLGSWLASLGAALAFGSAATLPLAAALLLLLHARVRREEQVLGRHFGESYREYHGRTGALLPRWFS